MYLNALYMKSQDINWLDIPKTAGVYFFKKGRTVLYVGKATSLRDRIKSYFGNDVLTTRGLKILNMVIEAEHIEWQEADSVLEALILESHLIKRYQPLYNTREKDDKSFNYVLITHETYPRVLLVRGKTLAEHEVDPKRFPLPKQKYLFGPFPKGGDLKEALRIIRKIIPYRSDCIPKESSEHTNSTDKQCFNAQLGLCPGVCMGLVSQKEYARTVNHLKLLFEGKKKKLLEELKKDMNRAANEERFEKAGKIKKQLTGLTHINDIALMRKRDEGVFLAGKQGGRVFRIEAYDVAHLGGTARVGVMVVIGDGVPIKSDYRKFKLAPNVIDDIAGLKELLRRRFNHVEWPYPDIVVVDGGVAQKNAGEAILKACNLSIPVIAVTKDEHHKPRELKGLKRLRDERTADILLANTEAHRFAITFHRARRRRYNTDA